MDAVNGGMALGGKAGQHQRGAGAEIAGGNSRGAEPLDAADGRRRPSDDDVGSQAAQLGGMQESAGKYAVFDAADSFAHRGQRRPLGLQVARNARIRLGDDVHAAKPPLGRDRNAIWAEGDFGPRRGKSGQHRIEMLRMAPTTVAAPRVIAAAINSVAASMRSGISRCDAPPSCSTP